MSTRKTSFYQIKHNNSTIIYRDLNVLELSYLLNLKNDIIKFDMAAKAAIVEPTELDKIPWPILQQIGQSALERSTKWIVDKELFEIIVKEYRSDIKDGNSPLSMIKEILQAFPGQSITELLKLTWRDLIEMTCLAEEVLGRKIFNVAGMPTARRKGSSLVNSNSFEDDGTSLQEKMNALNATLGGIPK